MMALVFQFGRILAVCFLAEGHFLSLSEGRLEESPRCFVGTSPFLVNAAQ